MASIDSIKKGLIALAKKNKNQKLLSPKTVSEPKIVPNPVSVPDPVQVPDPVKVVEPVRVPDPIQVPNPVKVSEPIQVQDPVNVPDPVRVQEPVKVPDPVRVQEPVKAAEPVEPVKVAEPVEPVKVAEPVEPVKVAEPVEPTQVPLQGSTRNQTQDTIQPHTQGEKAGNIEQPRRKTVEELAFRKAKYDSVGEKYQYESVNKQIQKDLNAISSPESRKALGERYNINNYDSMTNDQLIDAIMSSHKKRIDSGPNFMDHMMGNKVPQIATGALITAGLVNSMSNSKGRQSNSQLYGITPAPGLF